MSPRGLVVQTIYFHASERARAETLGADLYGHLTRSPSDPLAFGPGIPVWTAVQHTAVQLADAEVQVLLPVLGAESLQTMESTVLHFVNEWAETPRVHVWPIVTDAVWTDEGEQFPVPPLLTDLYGSRPQDDTPEKRQRSTVRRILRDIAGLFVEANRVPVFLCHAKAGLSHDKHIVQHVAEGLRAMGKEAFFDRVDFESGARLSENKEGGPGGVFIAFRGDQFSSRAWCQRELLQAKARGLPTITVEMLDSGESRSLAYGGNGPTRRWHGRNEDLDDFVQELATLVSVEWVRWQEFRLTGRGIAELAGLPSDEGLLVLGRPPELLDLAQGRLPAGRAALVMHPEPEQSPEERSVLDMVRSNLAVVTPTTAFRAALGHGAWRMKQVPLDGMTIGLSISDSEDVDSGLGYGKKHIEDAAVAVTRTFIAAGAAVAYGGDHRPDSYTGLFARLVGVYNQTAQRRARKLQNYVHAGVRADQLKRYEITRLHVGHAGGPQGELRAPTQQLSRLDTANHVSDMRSVMIGQIDAMIALGGSARPQGNGITEGRYGGALPGILEEVWRALKGNKPVYLIGGYGGMTGDIAQFFAHPENVPERLSQATFADNADYEELCMLFSESEQRSQLGLPKNLSTLRQEALELWRASDNGLSDEENAVLFKSRDPTLIAALVMRGLLIVDQRRRRGKLSIELVQADVAHARRLDMLAVSTFLGVPPQGAAAAIDEQVGGAVRRAHCQQRNIVRLTSESVDAGWLYLADLGATHTFDSSDQGALLERVRAAAQATARDVGRHVARLGVVTFGGSLIGDQARAARVMVEAFRGLGDTEIVWFERDPGRFSALRGALEALAQQPESEITLDVCDVRAPAPSTIETRASITIDATMNDNELRVTVLAPEGSPIAPISTRSLERHQVEAIATPNAAQPPAVEDLEDVRYQLADLLFGDEGSRFLAETSKQDVLVVHDGTTAHLPFELLHGRGEDGLTGDVIRQLKVAAVPLKVVFKASPRQGKLRVLVAGDPTEDLKAANSEAEQAHQVLESIAGVDCRAKFGREVTRDWLLDGFAWADMVHYAGHAFFDSPELGESGLSLHPATGCNRFTGKDLELVNAVPRVVFFNACRAARLRSAPAQSTGSFAELFLRSGIESYVGTFWAVPDKTAAAFAQPFYQSLVDGKSVVAAVRRARKHLFDTDNRHWVNYRLYGRSRFQLTG